MRHVATPSFRSYAPCDFPTAASAALASTQACCRASCGSFGLSLALAASVLGSADAVLTPAAPHTQKCRSHTAAAATPVPATAGAGTRSPISPPPLRGARAFSRHTEEDASASPAACEPALAAAPLFPLPPPPPLSNWHSAGRSLPLSWWAWIRCTTLEENSVNGPTLTRPVEYPAC